MRRISFSAAVILLLVAALIGFATLGRNRSTSARLPDGSEVRFVQRFTGTADLYESSLFVRKASGPWGWVYVSHEGWPWLNVYWSLDLTNQTAILLHGGHAVGDYSWLNGVFKHYARGTITAPQENIVNVEVPN